MALFGGVTPAAAAALYSIQAVLSAATAALLLLLGRRLGIARAGSLAGWLWALHPMSVWYAVNKLWDMEVVATSVTGFVVLLFHVGRGPRAAHAAGLGALFGSLVLLNPAVAALFPVVLLYLAPLPVRRALVTAGTCAASAFLVCLPWSLRNWIVLGSPGIRSNLGVELYVGNNDLADGQHRIEYHPGWTASETNDLRAMGEVEYSAHRGRRARAWIAEHPRRFLELCWTRASIFWIGVIPTHDRRSFYGVSAQQDPKSWIRWALHLATGVFGLLGTAALVRSRRSPEAFFIAGVLVLFPLAYYVIHVLERYRFPIEPLLLLAASWLLLKWRGDVASERRLAAGAPSGHDGSG
jgi:4-amino-4-deoxy-L-arabinose transferase-like glycosyltransferase